MRQFLQPIKSALGFFGGSGSQGTETEVNTSTSTNTAADTDASAPGEVRNQQLHEQSTVGTRKRLRPEDIVESGRKKMRNDRGERETHLFPNYMARPDAQPIAVPNNSEVEELQRPAMTRLSNRLGGGSFKSMNTLDDARYSSNMGNGRSRNTRIRPETTIGTLPRSALDIKGNRGSNAQHKTKYTADGFQPFDPVSKKQKLGNGIANPVPSARQIDLTEDDSQHDLSINCTERSTKKDTRSGTHLPRSSKLDESVASKTYQYTEVKSEKRKRKERDSQGSSQTSTRATPNGVEKPLHPNQKFVRQSPVEATSNDDHDEARVLSTQRTRNTGTIPGLSNGTSVRHPQEIRRGTDEDITTANSVLNDFTRNRSWRQDDRQQNVAQKQQQHQTSRNGVRTIMQTPRRLVPQITQPSQEKADSRLRDTFIRDETDDNPRPRQRASQRMQATSMLTEDAQTAADSEDELNGARTVESQASRSVSPQKDPAAMTRRPKARQETTSIREPTPSNLKPTEFYSSGRNKSKTSKLDTRSHVSDDGVRIPVNSVMCRSCFLVDVDAELVWDSKELAFYVESDGDLQKVPNKAQLVRIGSQEATQWIHAQSEGFLTVQMKGPQTLNSNGSIIISFKDTEGLSLCFDILSTAGKVHLRESNFKKEKMGDLVTRQGKEIEVDYNKYSRKKSLIDHDDVELVAMQARKNKRELRQLHDEEEIQYERDDSPPQQTRRSRMQARTSNVGEAFGEASKHFTYKTGRRSSRQTKPIKEKSPSPPPPVRWTHQNKLQRWSHSVIYPTEGTARRVTVDFQDLERLDEGEFLNDNIIGFALRRIEENMAPEHKDKVLYFNSFFYTALTTKSGKKAFNYDAVKRWTKSKDLFNYPYIIVPINIDLHWFVAIICNLPNLSRKPAALDDEPEDENENEMLLEAELGEEEQRNGIADAPALVDSDNSTTDAQKSLHHLSLSDEDVKPVPDKPSANIAADDVEAPSSSRPSTSSSKKSKKKAPPRQRSFGADTPAIITLDSFGSAHSVTIRILKDYLNAEAQAKRGMEVTKNDLQGVTAKGIPEQTNFCDCGVYVVGYVEEFVKDPQRFVTKVLQRNLDQQIEFASFNPSAKRAEIREELLKLHEEQEAERKGKKTAKKTTSVVNGEASKTAEASAPAKVQNEHETPAVPTKDLAAFVPLLPTSADLPETTKAGQGEIESASLDPGSGNLDDNELESTVPRAFEGTRLHLSRGGEILSSSSRAAEDLEDDGWDGFSDAQPNDQAHSDAAPVDVGHELLNGIEEYLDVQQGATQHRQKSPIASHEAGLEKVTSTVDRKTTDRLRQGDQRDLDITNLDGEDRAPLEIQDSQEQKNH